MALSSLLVFFFNTILNPFIKFPSHSNKNPRINKSKNGGRAISNSINNFQLYGSIISKITKTGHHGNKHSRVLCISNTINSDTINKKLCISEQG